MGAERISDSNPAKVLKGAHGAPTSAPPLNIPLQMQILKREMEENGDGNSVTRDLESAKVITEGVGGLAAE